MASRTRLGPPQEKSVRVAMALLAAEGKTQAEIARQFDAHQSTVSRVLSQAKDQGWLKTAPPSFDGSEIDPGVLKEARDLAQKAPELQDRIAALAMRGKLPHAVTVRVLRIADDGRSARNMDALFRAAGESAAPYVVDLLRDAHVCGLTWGHSVGAVVAGIESLKPSRSGRLGSTQVLPLCGEPLGLDSHSMFSSSALAERLSAAVNGSATEVLPLTMLPAFVPGDFSDAEVRAVWRLIGMMEAYAKIFGGRDVRVALREGRPGQYTHKAMTLDLILTGISAVGQPLGDGRGPLFASGKLTGEEFRRMVLGDIGGVLIERDDLSPKQRTSLASLATRWTGVSAVEMRTCAQRAAATDGRGPAPPGVVVMALGYNKSETVIEAIKRGLINHLLCDWELERAILMALQ